MSAVPKADDAPAILKFPTLFQPPPATRMMNPGVSKPRRKHKPDPRQMPLWDQALDPDVRAYAAAVEQRYRDPVVPEVSRAWIRDNLTLRAFYQDWMLQDRERRCAAKELSRGTISKDRQALSRWERYSRPEDWPEDKPWPGIPIGALTGRYVADVLTRMHAELGDSTARSTWGHLRTILNYAVQVRALDHAPKPERKRPEDRKVSVYRPEQIEAAFLALKDHVDLQVAFVLAINTGMRTVDLFSLKWSNCDLVGTHPTVTFTARKTRKAQTIPLAPVTVRHVLRLPSKGDSPWLFPGRSSPEAIDPERSRPARRRKELIAHRFAMAALTFEKPFQVARATCNTRLERARQGAGLFVLGHGLSLNAKSYHEPSDLIFEAVNAVEQPPCFALP
ncbi:MAG: tyrosine-type recombinase/integrase [Planctomycetaceae bacterium]|nr:tyrosine-type recombinase/integrase [Planctomycetaceae bacterium]